MKNNFCILTLLISIISMYSCGNGTPRGYEDFDSIASKIKYRVYGEAKDSINGFKVRALMSATYTDYVVHASTTFHLTNLEGKTISFSTDYPIISDKEFRNFVKNNNEEHNDTIVEIWGVDIKSDPAAYCLGEPGDYDILDVSFNGKTALWIKCPKASDSNVVPKNLEKGHEWVDLGLSVKWASCNLKVRGDNGYDHYSWGETVSSAKYDYGDWSSYFDTNDDGKTFSKYSTSKKTILDLENDAAHINWGGSWRMPTRAEFDELLEKCDWTWIEIEDCVYRNTGRRIYSYGFKVSSKINGNCIFLPEMRFDVEPGCSAGYWSSSLNESTAGSAYMLCFLNRSVPILSVMERSISLYVRAVCP